MQFRLGKNEHLIKSWVYSRADQAFNELIVTDRRVISRQFDESSLSIRELMIGDIRSISCTYNAKVKTIKKRAGFITCLILAILSAALAFIHLAFLAVPAVLLIMAFIFLACGTKHRRASGFSVRLSTYQTPGDSLKLSASDIALVCGPDDDEIPSDLVFTVDPNVTQEIINTIGSLIVENQQR